VIDTVNLRRIEQIIANSTWRTPDARSAIFELQYGDPIEIVQFCGCFSGNRRWPPGGPMQPAFRRVPARRSPSGGPPAGPGQPVQTATTVVIGSGEIPLILIPEPAPWIIARGSGGHQS
jgi:hypothetical protein